jgi:ATP-dependent Lon protease
MNAHGGSLVIGVSDTHEVIGLDEDLKLVARRDLDGYENWLTSLLENSLGKPAVTNATIGFEKVDGHDLCRLDVEPARAPVFVRSGKSEADLYVRLNNSTRLLNTAEALEYVRARWR